jgi:hypothetical protein
MFARIALGLALNIIPALALAGFVNVPADISVHLSAEPSTGLVAGQPITFTISATNHGPNPVDNLLLVSSTFVNEFDLSGGVSDCPWLGLVVADGKSFYYFYNLRPTYPNPMSVGETRTCRIILPVSSQAPASWMFAFGVASFYLDINPANNSASVTLRRALGATTPIPVPALSPIALILLVGLLAMIAKWAMARQVATHRSTSCAPTR